MNWNEVASIAMIVATLVGAATVYLRRFVANQLAEHERKLHTWLERNCHAAALIDLRFENLDARVSRLEASQD